MEKRNLRKLKAIHRFNSCEDFPRRRYNDLEEFANVDDVRLKRAPADTFEGVANALIHAAEKAEQEKIKANPPVTCKGYVDRSDYPLTSLYSDYKKLIEADAKEWTDYRKERKKWRKCKYRYCLNYFPIDRDNFLSIEAKRKDSAYCDDYCRYAENDANKRYRETGSYLPAWYYLPNLSESDGDRMRSHEFASSGESLEYEYHKTGQRRRTKAVKGDWGESGNVKASEVITYNINDLSDGEIIEKELQDYAENRVRAVGRIPYIMKERKG